MKSLTCKKLNPVLVLALLFSTALMAQTQTKRYSEKFNVDDEVKVEVNTSYTDLVFETWNRNQVEIEAVIEIEGISEEEAEKIFGNWGFKAVGNSDKITVTTGEVAQWNSRPAMAFTFGGDDNDFDFEYNVEVPDVDVIIESLPEDFVMPPMPPMPPLPENFRNFDFDYDAYKRDGDAYLKEWKKQFEENYDEDFIEQYEEWGKQIAEVMKEREEHMKDREEHMKELEKNREAHEKDRQKLMEERDKMREEIRRDLEKNRAEVRIAMEKVREEVRRAQREARAVTIMNGYKVKVAPGSDSKVFYYRNDGMPKNLKIKKTIRIKAPKGARLDLDVRHGEIKLAENYKNINATLSYARLHAPLVDGKNTEITASYSPMRVDFWREGALNVSYAKALELDQVQNIKLSSESSNVVVRELKGNAIINGSFGDLLIEKLSDGFNSLDIVLENSDATLVLPQSAFDIYARTTHTRMNTPANLKLNVNQLHNSKQLKGYSKSQGSGRSIHIIANYSNLNLKGI